MSGVSNLKSKERKKIDNFVNFPNCKIPKISEIFQF